MTPRTCVLRVLTTSASVVVWLIIWSLWGRFDRRIPLMRLRGCTGRRMALQLCSLRWRYSGRGLPKGVLHRQNVVQGNPTAKRAPCRGRSGSRRREGQ